MSSKEGGNLRRLEEEFKSDFPDLSNEIILACISQHGPDKEICKRILNNIRQSYEFSENISLSQNDRFKSEEANFRQESYDFKFNDSVSFQNRNSVVKGLNNLMAKSSENLEQNSANNENLCVSSLENKSNHATNGNFLPSTKPNTSNMFELPAGVYRRSSMGYLEGLPKSFVSQIPEPRHVRAVSPNMHTINQQEKSPEISPPYGHNYTRGYSYPTTNENISFKSQFSHPLPYSGLSASKLNPEDYAMPLYVVVTSSPHCPQTTLTTSPPRILIQTVPSPNFYPSALPHTHSYHTPRLSSVSFSQSFQSPVSASPPSISNDNGPPRPPLSVSPNIPFAYKGPFYLAENHQRSNEMPNSHPNYEIYSENMSSNFMNQNSYLKTAATIAPPLPNVLFLSHHQGNETKEDNAERAYRKALIQHQKIQLEMLKVELFKLKQFCYTLRKDVSLKEERLQGKRQNEFITMEQIQKVREENMKLRVECNCLTMEFDLQQKGQMRLGVVDEGFYKNIFTGPSIPNKNSEKKETLSSANASESQSEEGDKWDCPRCTYVNHPALGRCEMCDLMKPSTDG